MIGTRTALLIATDTYTDRTFSGLSAPGQDAVALAEVLGDRQIGGYRVNVLHNRPSSEVRLRINELYNEAGRDDQLLLYVSGHGVKDESGRLHLVATDTRRNLLAATAVSAQFIRELIDHSPARKLIVWLDCCYGGAFPAGMVAKAEGTVDVLDQLADSGRGCVVMTASTHIQFAYERGTGVTPYGQNQPSVFTSMIVHGLRTGEADLNDDGLIDSRELYDYVYDRVRDVHPDQSPTCNHQITGRLYIARRPPQRVVPAPQPAVQQFVAPAFRRRKAMLLYGSMAMGLLGLVTMLILFSSGPPNPQGTSTPTTTAPAETATSEGSGPSRQSSVSDPNGSLVNIDPTRYLNRPVSFAVAELSTMGITTRVLTNTGETPSDLDKCTFLELTPSGDVPIGSNVTIRCEPQVLG